MSSSAKILGKKKSGFSNAICTRGSVISVLLGLHFLVLVVKNNQQKWAIVTFALAVAAGFGSYQVIKDLKETRERQRKVLEKHGYNDLAAEV